VAGAQLTILLGVGLTNRLDMNGRLMCLGMRVVHLGMGVVYLGMGLVCLGMRLVCLGVGLVHLGTRVMCLGIKSVNSFLTVQCYIHRAGTNQYHPLSHT